MNFAKFAYLLPLVFSYSLASAPVHAADADAEAIIDELQTLAEKSRQQKAADRWLQNALEDLVAKYSFPWKNNLLSDDFSDGDYRNGVRWQVVSGEFWVDRRLGLRSNAETREIRQTTQEVPRQQEKDLGKALLGAFLQEAMGPQKSAPQQQTQTRTETSTASIRSAVNIPTTFAVEAAFSQNNRPGENGLYEWVVMQDEATSNAYKLTMATDDRNSRINLIRVTSGRESYVDNADVASLNDGAEHQLSWRQKASGEIDVFIDGTQIIKTSDKAFRYGFKHLGMNNLSGDFSISSISVLGGN